MKYIFMKALENECGRRKKPASSNGEQTFYLIRCQTDDTAK
jgi:hypothetical protein